MVYVFKLMVRAHVYLVVIVLVSFIIERVTGLFLLVTAFSEKKRNRSQAEGNTGLHTILYFIYLLLFTIYNVYFVKNAPAEYAFWKWLLLSVPLTVTFGIVYHKYQGREPEFKR